MGKLPVTPAGELRARVLAGMRLSNYMPGMKENDAVIMML